MECVGSASGIAIGGSLDQEKRDSADVSQSMEMGRNRRRENRDGCLENAIDKLTAVQVRISAEKSQSLREGFKLDEKQEAGVR